MSYLDLAIVLTLAVFVVLLIRAADLLGRNPHQQIREHEDLTGRFPADVPFSERMRLINLFGISPSNPGRIWTLLVVVGVFFVVLLWLR